LGSSIIEPKILMAENEEAEKYRYIQTDSKWENITKKGK